MINVSLYAPPFYIQEHDHPYLYYSYSWSIGPQVGWCSSIWNRRSTGYQVGVLQRSHDLGLLVGLPVGYLVYSVGYLVYRYSGL